MKFLIISILLSGLSYTLSACDKPDDGKMPKIATDEVKSEVINNRAQDRNVVE